jgi:hypothetical protein
MQESMSCPQMSQIAADETMLFLDRELLLTS